MKFNSSKNDVSKNLVQELPNILYIFTDQQWAGAMSCAGNQDVSTPAMDSLAENGIRFERAHCTSPVCSPSRASMLSGLMPHKHGVIKNEIPIASEYIDTCLEHLLADQGYDCAYAGKWHLTNYGGISTEDNKRHPYRFLAGLDGEKNRIENVTEACKEYISEKRTQPFFLIASYDTPHEICGWRDQEKGIQPDSTDHYPALPENFDIPENEASVLRDVYLSRHPEQQKLDAEGWQRYRWAYYRYIEHVDKSIGDLLTSLKINGLLENTLVIFSSDHGDGMGAHQWLGKCCHYDEVMRVPFIMSYPGKIAPKQVDKTRLVLAGADFYATVLDYAGINIPEDRPGLSLKPQGENFSKWRDELVSEIWVAGPGSEFNDDQWKDNPFGRMLLTDRYKYVIYECGEHREQLFDMQSDPYEKCSIAENDKAHETLQDHRKRLLAWCRAEDDEAGIKMLSDVFKNAEVNFKSI